jgi:hypothetical protein
MVLGYVVLCCFCRSACRFWLLFAALHNMSATADYLMAIWKCLDSTSAEAAAAEATASEATASEAASVPAAAAAAHEADGGLGSDAAGAAAGDPGIDDLVSPAATPAASIADDSFGPDTAVAAGAAGNTGIDSLIAAAAAHRTECAVTAACNSKEGVGTGGCIHDGAHGCIDGKADSRPVLCKVKPALADFRPVPAAARSSILKTVVSVCAVLLVLLLAVLLLKMAAAARAGNPLTQRLVGMLAELREVLAALLVPLVVLVVAAALAVHAARQPQGNAAAW